MASGDFASTLPDVNKQPMKPFWRYALGAFFGVILFVILLYWAYQILETLLDMK